MLYNFKHSKTSYYTAVFQTKTEEQWTRYQLLHIIHDDLKFVFNLQYYKSLIVSLFSGIMIYTIDI